MGLIFCMECRKEVSDKARKCPHCGAPIASGAVSWVAAPSRSRNRSGAIRVVVKAVLLIVVLGGAWWLWQAATSDKKAPFSAGLTAAFREPRKIADERLSLVAGQHVSYDFKLETDSRVHVRVSAVTDPVDMMLMSKTDAQVYRRTGGALFGGGYSGFPAFSSSRVGIMDKTEVVPTGEWSLVLVRPKSGASGKAESAAEVAVTVY